MSRIVNPTGPQVVQAAPHTIRPPSIVHSRVIGTPTVVVTGPIFALVQPVSYPVETQPPAQALHPEADHHDVIAAGADFLLVVVVILIAGWTQIVRLVRVTPS